VLDRHIFTERLVQVANRAGLNTRPQSLVREGGNEYNYGHTVAIGNQPALQLDSIQAGHLNIRDQLTFT
jgi:hypothetical protein